MGRRCQARTDYTRGRDGIVREIGSLSILKFISSYQSYIQCVGFLAIKISKLVRNSGRCILNHDIFIQIRSVRGCSRTLYRYAELKSRVLAKSTISLLQLCTAQLCSYKDKNSTIQKLRFKSIILAIQILPLGSVVLRY